MASEKDFSVYSETPEATISQIKQILNIVIEDLAAAESQGVFLWGPPGIGKSSLVKQVAKERKMELVDLRLPLMDPVDLRGLPMIDSENGKARWLPPDFLPDAGADPGIIFLDEINAAPPSVQASAYQLVLDRKLGNYKLPEGWIVIAAGNRTSDRSVAYRLPTALANRFTHFQVKVDLNEWVEWAWKVRLDPTVISFIRYTPSLLMRFDPKTNSTAFPTPRSWEFISRLAKLREENFQLYIKAVKGTIGEAASQQFIAFLNYRDTLPDPKEILTGKAYDIPDQVDAQFALLGGLINELLNMKSEEAVTNFFHYVAQYEETLFSDHAVVLVREALQAFSSNGIREIISSSPEFRNWLRRNQKVLL